jgi:FixJ family two-component response regulator
MVQRLREQGCKYIVVVTADPTVKEARSIFREAFGYDYWEKTYDTDRIYHQILRCIQEINSNNDSAWKEEPIANTLLDIFSRKERE